MVKVNTSTRGKVWTVAVGRFAEKGVDRSCVGVAKRKRLDWAQRKGFDVRVKTLEGRIWQWGTWEEIKELESKARFLSKIGGLI